MTPRTAPTRESGKAVSPQKHPINENHLQKVVTGRQRGGAMRRHRVALIVIPFVALMAALTPILSAGPAAPAHKETTPWTSSVRSKTTQQLAAFRTSLITTADLAPLATFAKAVEAWQLEQLAYVVDSSTAASSPTPTESGPSAPAPISTPTAASGVDEIPAAWQATATCEEGGRDDPNYGYFGIQEWNGFDGYPSAGAAPLSVQLAWEAAQGISPPDAPGQCHSY